MNLLRIWYFINASIFVAIGSEDLDHNKRHLSTIRHNIITAIPRATHPTQRETILRGLRELRIYAYQSNPDLTIHDHLADQANVYLSDVKQKLLFNGLNHLWSATSPGPPTGNLVFRHPSINHPNDSASIPIQRSGTSKSPTPHSSIHLIYVLGAAVVTLCIINYFCFHMNKHSRSFKG
jgi:hypothetical protein